MARTGAPERRELSGRRRAHLGWSPWLVALLAVIAVIAAFAIARATYSGDVCWAEYNERLGQPWVEANNGRVFGTTEEAGCGGATPREPEVSEVFSRAYGPTKALAESLSLERWAERRQELRRLPRDPSHKPWHTPTAAGPDRFGYAAA